jgi:pyruvate dehydrogenase E2 component (dihydrolipoamide acetyltransferase)
MTEGGIAQWKKKEGESFAAGDVLVEIETDKATIDVEAQDDGVLAKIMVSGDRRCRGWDAGRGCERCLRGERGLERIGSGRCTVLIPQVNDGAKSIQVGTPIAIIGEEGDDLSGADALASEASSAPAPKKEEPKQDSKPSTTPSVGTPADETKYGSGDAQTSPQKAPQKPSEGDKPKFFASPVARKIALERGVPLGQVKGTGPEGRITKVSVADPPTDDCNFSLCVSHPADIAQEDVEKFKGGSASTAATSTTPGSPASVAPAEYEDVPTSNMRRTIGKRLTESKQQIPHYYLTVEINMGA